MRFADAYVEIHANTKRIQSDMNKAKTVVKGGFSQITSMAKTAGVAIAGFLGARVVMGFGKSLIAAAADSSEKLGILEQVLETTGHAAGFTVEQLDKVANDLQRVTKFSDEATKEAMAIIATFPKIKGDAFIRTTEAALDLATVMKTDAKSAAVQLAKALQDPERNLSMLNRSGISFTTQQIDMVKQLIKTGKALEAHNIILTEIERQYGKVARAAGKTLAGQLAISENAWFDFKEEMGRGITKGAKMKHMLGETTDSLHENQEAAGEWSTLFGKALFIGALNLKLFGLGVEAFGRLVNNMFRGLGVAAETFTYTLGTQMEKLGKLTRMDWMRKAGKKWQEDSASGIRGLLDAIKAEDAELNKSYNRLLDFASGRQPAGRGGGIGNLLSGPGAGGGTDAPGADGGTTGKAPTLRTIASSALAGARGISAPGIGTLSTMRLAGGMSVPRRDEGPTRRLQQDLLDATKEVAANTKQPAVATLG